MLITLSFVLPQVFHPSTVRMDISLPCSQWWRRRLESLQPWISSANVNGPGWKLDNISSDLHHNTRAWKITVEPRDPQSKLGNECGFPPKTSHSELISGLRIWILWLWDWSFLGPWGYTLPFTSVTSSLTRNVPWCQHHLHLPSPQHLRLGACVYC